MFFSSFDELLSIIKNTDTGIICLNEGLKISDEVFSFERLSTELKNVFIIAPGQAMNASGKPINAIVIDQVREIIEKSNTKQGAEQYFIVREAEKMREEAQNAFLKVFEEPKLHFHYILFTSEPLMLLQTIRSRAKIFQPVVQNKLSSEVVAPEKVKMMAKKMLSVRPTELLSLAESLAKEKEETRRENTLLVISTAIEIAYKSYFKTGNQAFLKKIEKLTAAYDGIRANGNLKLQIVANLC